MNHWLMKSEPSVFSIDDLRQKGVAPWDGVRNYMARNFMMQMKAGDLAFFYHSSEEPVGIAGIMEIARTAYPDHTAWDPASDYHDPKSTPEKPRWYMVDVRFVRKLDSLVELSTLRKQRSLKKMILLRPGNRLSVMPVSPKEWDVIVSLSGTRAATA